MTKTQVVVGRSFGKVHGVTVVNAYLIQYLNMNSNSNSMLNIE